MLQVKHLVKRYTTKGETITALADVSVDFPEKGMVFLLGKSGSGKSTLLNVAGGLDSPDEGEVVVKGKSSKDFSKSDFDSYRNTYVGFIFQEYNILNELTVAENVALALELQGRERDEALVEKLLSEVDLKGCGGRRPNTLSGGQKQRVAIARALVKDPEIIMADEPTGALDSATGMQVFDTLKKLSAEKLVVVVSHDRGFAEHYADRIIELADGKIVSDMSRSEGESVYVNLTEGERELTVACGAAITEEEMQKVVSFLKRHKESVTLTVGEKTAERSRAVFRATDLPPQPREEESGKFIRSAFPFRYALRMGLSWLKFKPVRLIFTTLLAAVAFIVFGVFSTLVTYSPVKLNASTLEDSAFSTGVLQKKGVVHSVNEQGEPYDRNFPSTPLSSLHFDARDVARLEVEYPEMDFVPVFSFHLDPLDIGFSMGSEDSGFYYSQMDFFNGFAEADEIRQKTGFALSEGRWPEVATDSACEVAISRATFEAFRALGFREETGTNVLPISSFADLEGRNIFATVGVTRFCMKVVGVVDTEEDFSAYEYLKTASSATDAETSALRELYRYSFASIGIVAEDFYETYQENDLAPSFYRNEQENLQRDWRARNTTSYEEHPEEGILYSFLYTTLKKNRSARCLTLMKFHRTTDEERDIYYFTPYSFTDEIAAGDRTLSQTVPIVAPIAAALAVFSALLLFNFISASINAKRRDVGVLRAVGARGIDVFKIFMVEGFVLTSLCFLLGCCGSLAVCAVANAVLVGKGILAFGFFSFGWQNALILLGVALVTAAFSTAVPVALNVRKKPVETIRTI